MSPYRSNTIWHINFQSGGVASWYTGKLIAERHGTGRLIHLFTDTRNEDGDLYRFLYQGTHAVGGVLVHIADGRTLWELFNDERFIANSRVDICSRVMKRDLARQWITERFGPDECTLYFGIDHSERARLYGNGKNKAGILERWLPYRVEAPLCEPPFVPKCEMLKECERLGIDPPRMYDEGFAHNNCGGFCVKGGHAHFLQLLQKRPEVFDYHATKEEEFRQSVGKDVAILRDRKGGKTTPLPMAEFRRQVESGERKVNRMDWGEGCQCFTPEEEETSGN